MVLPHQAENSLRILRITHSPEYGILDHLIGNLFQSRIFPVLFKETLGTIHLLQPISGRFPQHLRPFRHKQIFGIPDLPLLI